MNTEISISDREVERWFEKLHREAEASGYHLNPDREFTKDLIQGLLVNKKRYGYIGCPCRLNSGDRQEDIDIICPCYYRDADLVEYDMCYCALYVSERVLEGEKKTGPIPERRPRKRPQHSRKEAQKMKQTEQGESRIPLWRCNVCGYLCARDKPPGRCPICQAEQDRFDRFEV